MVIWSWLHLLSQNSVMQRMFLMGKLTYKSFLSNVMILLFSLIWILFSSCTISCEFLMVCVFGRFIRPCNFLLRNLVTLYDGVCVLFIKGQIGLSSLCVFMYALIIGAVCFIFIKYLCLPFSTSVSHFWRACLICF